MNPCDIWPAYSNRNRRISASEDHQISRERSGCHLETESGKEVRLLEILNGEKSGGLSKVFCSPFELNWQCRRPRFPLSTCPPSHQCQPAGSSPIKESPQSQATRMRAYVEIQQCLVTGSPLVKGCEDRSMLAKVGGNQWPDVRHSCCLVRWTCDKGRARGVIDDQVLAFVTRSEDITRVQPKP